MTSTDEGRQGFVVHFKGTGEGPATRDVRENTVAQDPKASETRASKALGPVKPEGSQVHDSGQDSDLVGLAEVWPMGE